MCDLLVENLYFYMFTIISSGVGAYFGAYLKNKAKYKADNENFENIKTQLSINTRLVKEIEILFSERSWISQQVWLKKQESYGRIFSLFLDVKKYIEQRVNDFEDYQHNLYDGIESPPQDDAAKQEEKNKYDMLKSKHDNAIRGILDVIAVQSIYVDPEIEGVINELKVSIYSSYDYEMWDEHFKRHSDDLNIAFEKIRKISIRELKIAAFNVDL